ncbi:MAG TPA: LacI family DNA-binding transcriptional regulator [Candidatus Limnocylindrales bacterium]|nr:LacI family DNA-binding transcriptional regulator [Candidatus Limnocylindrales bacterium]
MAKQRPRPTSADVASRAGVSRTTVSLVLNERGGSIPEPTRRRVYDAARALGYHPHHSARGLAGGRTQTIALVLRQSAEQVAEDALLTETLRGIAGAARAADLRVLIEPLMPGEAYSDLVRSGRADGLVVSGPLFDDPELRDLVGDGFPVVIQGNAADVAAPSVDVDNVTSARTAVEHLIDLGHRRIACITNAPLVYTAAADRLEGYREALLIGGLTYDEALVAEGTYDAASGHRAAARLLASTDFTALFVASDVVALGAMRGLREAGLVIPRDVSVVGFDDIALAEHFDPPLTSVRVPARAIGEAAGRVLVDRIAGQVVPVRTILPTELVIRESTATPAKRRGGAEGGTH